MLLVVTLVVVARRWTAMVHESQGGVTPIGTVYRAATGVKIFDRRKMALTA